MHDAHFDTLARTLARTGTRRGLVRLVALLAGGAALPTAGADEAAAERPLNRMHRRTWQRNRKQRTKTHHQHHGRGGQHTRHGKGNSAGECQTGGLPCGDILGRRCCGALTCTTSATLVLSTCQLACANDEICQQIFSDTQTRCLADALHCPFITGGKCCVAKFCLTNGDCAAGFTCKDFQCQR